MPQMEGSRKRDTALLRSNLVSLNVETDKPMRLFPPSLPRNCLPMGRTWPVPLATSPLLLLVKSPGTECAGQSGQAVSQVFLKQGSETDVGKVTGVRAGKGFMLHLQDGACC